jgi:hypothetical protein
LKSQRYRSQALHCPGFHIHLFFQRVESDRIACLALRAKLKKHHLSTDLNVLSAMDRHLTMGHDSAHTPGTPAVQVVESRLLSSKVLAFETTRAVESLKVILFPTSPDNDLTSESANVSGAVESYKRRNEAGTVEELDESSSSSDLDSNDRTESGSGSASEEEQVTGFEPGTEHESSSDDDETRHREKKDPDPHSGTGVQPSAKSKAIIAESDSLPPLAVGYARGDSDGTEWSDSEAKPAVTRKNRRGQRARRAYVFSLSYSFPIEVKAS